MVFTDFNNPDFQTFKTGETPEEVTITKDSKVATITLRDLDEDEAKVLFELLLGAGYYPEVDWYEEDA